MKNEVAAPEHLQRMHVCKQVSIGGGACAKEAGGGESRGNQVAWREDDRAMKDSI